MIDYEYCKQESQAYIEHRDCTVIALAISGQMPYEDAHAALELAGRKPRRGASERVIFKAFAIADLLVKKIEHTGKTPITIIKDCDKDKRYFAYTRNHMFAIVNSEVQDWTQGRRHRIEALYEVIE